MNGRQEIRKPATILLASASPRRRQILQNAGFFTVVQPTHVDELEHLPEHPNDVARTLAERKARAALDRGAPWTPSAPDDDEASEGAESTTSRHVTALLAADTLVWLDKHTILNKPEHPEHARAMLRTLAGREHTVTTAYAIVGPERALHVAHVETTVRFWPLSAEEIDAYTQSEEPYDKAGAYGVQGYGAALVERIDGSYHNVVGLPIGHVIRDLRRLGLLHGAPWAARR